MRIAFTALALVAATAAVAQQPPSGQTLATTLEMYVFPTEGQDAEQQSKDEADCFGWANTNTGVDPFELTRAAEAQERVTEAEAAAAARSGQGSGARGAIRGAAAGALIGEIADDDAGEGAAYGAAAGMIRGRRRGREAARHAEAEAIEQGQAQQEQIEEQIENFKKAMSVCLEAKEYMVRF